jgi:3-oxoacyl-[acyl-carrier protein] reductase
MKDLLINKTILITWASWDIWFQTALDCYHQWATIILLAHKNKQKLLDIFSEYDKNRVFIYSCDATDENEVKEIFDVLKLKSISLDWLFNNAWDLIERISIEYSSWDLYQKTFEINVKSAYLFTKYSLDIFNKNSSIVMMSSMTARAWNWDRSSHYWMSKWGILSLSKCLSNELAKKYWIRVNTVAPWYIKWSFHEKFTKKEVEIEHAIRNPLSRVWVPKDVSWVVIFLLSDMSSYVNWAIIDINWWSYVS